MSRRVWTWSGFYEVERDARSIEEGEESPRRRPQERGKVETGPEAGMVAEGRRTRRMEEEVDLGRRKRVDFEVGEEAS